MTVMNTMKEYYNSSTHKTKVSRDLEYQSYTFFKLITTLFQLPNLHKLLRIEL